MAVIPEINVTGGYHVRRGQSPYAPFVVVDSRPLEGTRQAALVGTGRTTLPDGSAVSGEVYENVYTTVNYLIPR